MKLTTKQILWISGGIAGLFVVLALIKKMTPYKKKMLKTANKEWARFGYTTRDKDNKWVKVGAKEHHNGFWERVGDYWKQALNKNYTGKDRDVAWSSAFISWVMDKSGGLFNIPFRKSSSHSRYIREYVKNRKDGKLSAPFVAYRISEKPAEVGDLVCYSRENATDLYDKTGSYKSHCDIVVAKRPNEIEVIGGNVNQSVSKRILATDRGRVVDPYSKWFAIIKNNA
jgi:hypothetical protein